MNITVASKLGISTKATKATNDKDIKNVDPQKVLGDEVDNAVIKKRLVKCNFFQEIKRSKNKGNKAKENNIGVLDEFYDMNIFQRGGLERMRFEHSIRKKAALNTNKSTSSQAKNSTPSNKQLKRMINNLQQSKYLLLSTTRVLQTKECYKNEFFLTLKLDS